MNPAAPNASTETLAQLFEPIRDDLRAVEEEFARHVQSQIAVIPEIGNYVRDSGGKRIRPAVLLMASRMAGYAGERAVHYAAVIEFIHSATLVHDDIIDESELRRGREAAHTRWGNHLSVLFGDFLYLKSMSLALTHDLLDVVRVLCDVTLRVVEGEIYQLTKKGAIDLSEDEHFEIVRRKTAVLFAGSARIGGMLGPTTREQPEALWEYGFNIGMAFQVVDDLLDFTGEESTLGKPVGGDLSEGKLTLPVIHLLAAGRAGVRDLVGRIAAGGAVTVGDWRELRASLSEAGSIEYARRRAVEFTERAKRALRAFPPGPARDALEFLPDFVLSRDR